MGKLDEFVICLERMLQFVAPEYRPPLRLVDEYHPYNNPAVPVRALLIGDKLAAFVNLEESGEHRKVFEMIRVEYTTPDEYLVRRGDEDTTLMSSCGINGNAYFVVEELLKEFAEPFRKEDHRLFSD